MQTKRFALLVISLVLPFAAAAGPATPVVAFNAELMRTAEAEDGFLTLKGLRTATMMHLAIHDVLAAISPRYEAYLYEGRNKDADDVVAAVEAAYTVVVSQYPDATERFALLRDQYRQVKATGKHRASSDFGATVAHAYLEARQGDGWDTSAEYRWHPMAPGVYAEFSEHSGTPEGFVFGAGWARARPFALQRADQFRAPPPPAIDSADYTAAFDEVKSVGRFQSPTRTVDQTHLALWWKDFAENSHNRLARDLAAQENLDLQSAARLFALLNVAIYDAYVSVFENKFHYNFWRPYTAIRWAGNDGNPATIPEESWTNTHRHTYAFPSYPSAHGTACAAAMRAFTDVFGDDYAFTMRIPRVDIAGPLSGKIEMQPATRSFPDFTSAANECGLSRLYLGIHFRFDSTAGVNLGASIGDYVVSHYLMPN